MDYSQKTQKLIDKLCKLAERKSFVLKKKEAQETILKTYDLFVCFKSEWSGGKRD